jgi:hypothetical protein
MLTNTSSGTNSIVVLSGSMNPNTLILTNGYSITASSSDGILNIPGTVDFLIAGTTWDGLIYAPTLSTGSILEIGDTGVISSLPMDTPTTDYSYTILATFMAGATGATSLIANTGSFDLSIQVMDLSVNSGSVLTILRSNMATSWTASSPSLTCTLDMNRMCTFTTNHLSYFGFVNVTSTPIASPVLVPT